MFIHEYANDGTLRQYLNRNFSMLNWNDKLNLAKQFVSAIKYLHENDIAHLNLVICLLNSNSWLFIFYFLV